MPELLQTKKHKDINTMIDTRNMTTKTRLNIMLVFFGVVAIIFMAISLGLLVRNYLGKSIEENVKSDITNTTQKLSENANYQASNADSIVDAVSNISDNIRLNASQLPDRVHCYPH